MSDVYFGEFNNREELFDRFNKKDCGEEILFAYYDQASYSGSALVIFRDKDNEVFEVNASHCSCYGLENQWEPEMVVTKELKNRKMPWIFIYPDSRNDIENKKAQTAFEKVIEKLSGEK